MNEGSNHINYSAEDIEKYHLGALSPADMHAMEKAALDDPFLADAIEGYQLAHEKNIDRREAVEELQQSLAARVKEKDTVPAIGFAWWKIAAVLILLTGGVWFYKLVNSKSAEQSVVVNEKKGQQPIPASQPAHDSLTTRNSDTVAVSDGLALNEKIQKRNNGVSVMELKKEENKMSQPVARMDDVSPAKPSQNPLNEKRETVTAGKAASKISSKDDTLANTTAVSNAVTNNEIARENADKKEKAATEAFMKTQPAAGISTNTFNGMVVDQSNKPVPNASVQVPILNKAFVTDNNGNFSFKAPDTALTVSVGSVGFEQQNIRLNNSVAFNQVTLKPSNQSLNDVVVVGYGAKKSRQSRRLSKDFSINVLDAEPSVDWNEYTQYLEKNKRLTNETKDIHGDVVVSFVINNKNELVNFKIEKSLQADLDAEAIRLIKEGPSWKLIRGKKAKASVIVKF